MLSSRLSLTTSQNFEDDTNALCQFLSIFILILKSIIGWSKKREKITVCTVLKKRPLYLPLGQKTAILCLNLKNALRCADRGHSMTVRTNFCPIFDLTFFYVDNFHPNKDKTRHFLTNSPPHLVHVVFKRPQLVHITGSSGVDFSFQVWQIWPIQKISSSKKSPNQLNDTEFTIWSVIHLLFELSQVGKNNINQNSKSVAQK